MVLSLLLFGAPRWYPVHASDRPLTDDPRVKSALELLGLWLDAQVAYGQIPGASAAVVHDQDLLWSRGFGYADRESRNPASPQTIYSICSISKLFTSVSVMQLWEEDKLHLESPVSDYLSWFDIQNTFPDGLPITVEGLLTHSAGLPRESDYPYWTGPDFDFPTRDQVIQRLSRQKTLYPAERYFQYSNLGLTLAGEIVAVVSGRPYAEYVSKNVLEPLGLKDTRPELPSEERGKRLATGYSALRRDGTRDRLNFFEAEGITPAAGFSSTAEDLGRFASWQFRLLENGGHEVLNAATLREMHRVHWVDGDWTTHWGLGFSVWRSDDETFVGHGGSCPGYRTHLLIQTDHEIATIFMANALGVNPNDFTQNAYRIVAPAIEAAIETPGKAKEALSEFDKYAGTYSDSFGGEIAVLKWEDGLAMIGLPTDRPMKDLVKLRHVEGNRFRRVRDDGALGETILFEAGPDGVIRRMVHFSNYFPKVR